MQADDETPTSAAPHFLRDRRGAVAIVFALALLPLLGMTGVALDYARAVRAGHALQHAVDAAALAAAAEDATGRNAAPRAVARRVLRANLPDFRAEGFAYAQVGDRHIVSAVVNVRTSFTALLGLDELEVSRRAVAETGGGAIEVVLAFDVTNSMGFGTSWEDATDAVMSSLGALRSGAAAGEFHASFLPFTDRVNIGERPDTWFSPKPEPDAGFTGCVEPRETTIDGMAHRLTDDPPRGADRLTPTQDGTYGAIRACSRQPIVGPTSDLEAIEDAIAGLSRSGTGRIDEGMAWAWRLVSPNWRGLWGDADYPARDSSKTRKVVALFTDGHNTAHQSEWGNPHDFGRNNGSIEGFEHLVALCGDMKEAGIEIHAMHINGNEHAAPYLRDCASSSGHYHKVGDEASLDAALAALVGETVSVRLVE